MECQDVLMGLAKYTIALGSSSFDMGSDFVNGLTLLGYFEPKNENTSAFNSSFLIENDINKTAEISEVTSDNIEDQTHQTWGILSILLIFWPGFVYGFSEMISAIYEREWRQAFFILVIGTKKPGT